MSDVKVWKHATDVSIPCTESEHEESGAHVSTVLHGSLDICKSWTLGFEYSLSEKEKATDMSQPLRL